MEYAIRIAQYPDGDDVLGMVFDGSHDGKDIAINFSKDDQSDKIQYQFSTDIDSLIWTGLDPPVKNGFEIAIFPNRTNNLGKDNKFKFRHTFMKQNQLVTESIGIHTCPNFEFATGGPSNKLKLLLCFPDMRHQNITKRNGRDIKGRWTNYLTNVQYQILYDQIIFPSIMELLPGNQASRFPNSFKAAESQSRLKGGGSIYPTKFFSGDLRTLIRLINQKLTDSVDDTLTPFKHMFIHIYGLNLKLYTGKVTGSPVDSAKEHFNQIIEWEEFERDENSYLDLGVDIYSLKSDCPVTLIWIWDALSNLCEGAFRSSRKDSYLHSSSLSGIGASAIERFHSACLFFQAYLLDKEKTQRFAGTFFEGIDKSDILKRSKKFVKRILALEEILKGSDRDSCGIRLEWRLAASIADDILPRINEWLPAFLNTRPFIAVPTMHISHFKRVTAHALSKASELCTKSDLKEINAGKLEFISRIVIGRMISLVQRPPLDNSKYRQFINRPDIERSMKIYDQPFNKLQPFKSFFSYTSISSNPVGELQKESTKELHIFQCKSYSERIWSSFIVSLIKGIPERVMIGSRKLTPKEISDNKLTLNQHFIDNFLEGGSGNTMHRGTNCRVGAVSWENEFKRMFPALEDHKEIFSIIQTCWKVGNKSYIHHYQDSIHNGCNEAVIRGMLFAQFTQLEFITTRGPTGKQTWDTTSDGKLVVRRNLS